MPSREEISEPPSDSQPINNTLLRRVLTLAAIKLLRRFRPRQGVVLFLTRKICVKRGALQSLSEAATMRFIAQNTSIPVPKVYCSFRHRGVAHIVMERIDGDMLGRGWAHRSPESKARILGQLKEMLVEMRNISPPKDVGVESVDGGPLFDGRIAGAARFGPFKTVQEFHRHLRGGHVDLPDHPTEVRELISQHEGPWPEPCFTHADLSSLNILVRGDDVVGIVDWETAGWYPTYWEYTTAKNVNPRNRFWRDEIDKFLEPMPKELAMDYLRDKYFGDIPFF